MRVTFRDGFYGGFGAALLVGLFLLWLWQPERQVSRHTQKLLHGIEGRDWQKVAELIDSSYTDQWGHDRSQLLERIRAVMQYVRAIHFTAHAPVVNIEDRTGIWIAKITIEGNGGEALIHMRERINLLSTPFELEWRRLSAKPWDWKLVYARNSTLEIPAPYE